MTEATGNDSSDGSGCPACSAPLDPPGCEVCPACGLRLVDPQPRRWPVAVLAATRQHFGLGRGEAVVCASALGSAIAFACSRVLGQGELAGLAGCLLMVMVFGGMAWSLLRAGYFAIWMLFARRQNLDAAACALGHATFVVVLFVLLSFGLPVYLD
jgi:hypothetical protein